MQPIAPQLCFNASSSEYIHQRADKTNETHHRIPSSMPVGQDSDQAPPPRQHTSPDTQHAGVALMCELIELLQLVF
jgi:hypothetical protein